MSKVSIRAKKRIINYDVDKLGRPVFVIAKYNNLVLTMQLTKEEKHIAGQLAIPIIKTDQPDITNYFQSGFKIYSGKYIPVDHPYNISIKLEELELWISKIGFKYLISGLILLLKTDSFYENDSNEHILQVALSQSILSKDLKNHLKLSMKYYKPVQDSQILEFTKHHLQNQK